MSEAAIGVERAWVGLAVSRAAVEDLREAELTSCADAEVLNLVRDLDRLRNQLATVEHKLIAELESRGLAHTCGARNIAALLRDLLRIHPRDAVARVKAADAAGPRRSLTGEPLPPVYEKVADAQARGDISPRHAALIVTTIEGLPDSVQASEGAEVEATLVDKAEQFDPFLLGRLAERISLAVDPDGKLHDAEHRNRQRDITVRPRPDGSGTGTMELTAELMERLQAAFDTLARPKPEVGGQKDPRTAGQRRHDALLGLINLIQRAELLPDVGGVTSTIVLHMSEEAWRTGIGCATTGHGAVIPASEAIAWAGGDAKVVGVVLNSMREVTRYSTSHRIFTETQRHAMAARDGGCSFPGCDVPAAWTQAHHIIEWNDAGPTSITNGTLLCGHHHRMHAKQGWTCRMIHGRPAWIPPPWLDPTRAPRHNSMHRPLGDTGPPDSGASDQADVAIGAVRAEVARARSDGLSSTCSPRLPAET